MDYTKQRVWELLQTVPWRENASIRLFWIRQSEGLRDEFAASLLAEIDNEVVVALVLRSDTFRNPNAVLADVMTLFDLNRVTLESLAGTSKARLTVLIVAKEEFRLMQASSPITLPDWFPICPASETHFYITDLGQSAEVEPLNCPEARLEHVAQLIYHLEFAIVHKLKAVHAVDHERVNRFLTALSPSSPPVHDAQPLLDLFEKHLQAINDERAYRPNAADKSKFLAARILKLALNSSPKELGAHAEKLAECLDGSDSYELKQTFFAIMWRPANKMPLAATNWNAVLVAFYQGYQLMNASAHAGEFPAYPIVLQHSSSVNLRRALAAAKDFVDSLS